ncbi:DUF4232 domain-containing protein [Streptomyces sp. NPDC047928]|uniref:DUF4232 domain-containing protein n=1 Tax=unclassified Streptomyces TaxID=2593676 RepID=UPI0037178351
MPIIRTRRTATSVIAAVPALALALSLTACGPEDPSYDGSPSVSAPPTATAAPTPGDKGGTDGAPTPTTPTATPPGATQLCGTADVTFTATLAEPTTSSYLLKVTNKTGKPCLAHGYPVVTFGDLDGAATHREETHPGTDLTLAPGESAYAGLMGGRHDGKGKTVNSIAMTMETESDLEQTPLTASTPGLYVSPDASVTAWVGNVEDALSL